MKILEEIKGASIGAKHHELTRCAQKGRQEEKGEILMGKKRALV